MSEAAEERNPMSERPIKIIPDDPQLTEYLNVMEAEVARLRAELAKAREEAARLKKQVDDSKVCLAGSIAALQEFLEEPHE